MILWGVMSMEIMRFCKLYMHGGIDLPIRPSEMGVLNIICSSAGPHTPVSVAQRLGVSRPMIAAHLNVLVSHGLVLRIPSPEDGRSFYIMPTKCGKDLFERVSNFERERLNAIESKLGQKKFAEFIRLVAAVNQVLETV